MQGLLYGFIAAVVLSIFCWLTIRFPVGGREKPAASGHGH